MLSGSLFFLEEDEAPVPDRAIRVVMLLMEEEEEGGGELLPLPIDVSST